MKTKRNTATWLGIILGTVMALALNATLAHASDEGASVREEFHQGYPLSANGRVALENINGAAHISVWTRTRSRSTSSSAQTTKKALRNMEILVEPRTDLFRS